MRAQRCAATASKHDEEGEMNVPAHRIVPDGARMQRKQELHSERLRHRREEDRERGIAAALA